VNSSCFPPEDTTGMTIFVVVPTLRSTPASSKVLFSVKVSRRDCSRAFGRYLQVGCLNLGCVRRLRDENDCWKMRKTLATRSSTVQWLVRRPSAMTEPELDRMLERYNIKITVDLRFQSSPFPNNYIEEYFDKDFTIEFLFYESKDL
jgi:hypothetical protein